MKTLNVVLTLDESEAKELLARLKMGLGTTQSYEIIGLTVVNCQAADLKDGEQILDSYQSP